MNLNTQMPQCNAGNYTSVSTLHDVQLSHRDEFSFFFFFFLGTVFSGDYALYARRSITVCDTHVAFPRLAHTRSGVHPALLPLGAGNYFLEQTGQALPITEVEIAWSYTSTSHSPSCLEAY